MKRTALRRRTPLKRTVRLRVVGAPDATYTKTRIQEVARDIVIKRDGGCILRAQFRLMAQGVIPPCGGYRKDGELILQADHLITRGNAATYADTRLIVCVCKVHHGWKSVGSNQRKALYDGIMKGLVPPDRVALWERCEAESWRAHRTSVVDWKLQLAALEAELRAL